MLSLSSPLLLMFVVTVVYIVITVIDVTIIMERIRDATVQESDHRYDKFCEQC